MIVLKLNKGADARHDKSKQDRPKAWRSFADIVETQANEPRFTSKRISYRDWDTRDTTNPHGNLNLEEIKILNDRHALLSYDDKKSVRHKIYQKLERVNESNEPSLFNQNSEKTEITI